MAGNGDNAGFEVINFFGFPCDGAVGDTRRASATVISKIKCRAFRKLEVGSSFQTHPGGSDPTHRITEMETDGSAPKCSSRRICCPTSLWTMPSSRQSVSAPTTIG